MADSRLVLVTGVADYWGSRVAAGLVDSGYRVMGLDAKLPEAKIANLDFVQADVRNPALPELLRSEGVDTVCHLAFQESDHASESTFDFNIIGTQKLLGACGEAGVRRVVLRSSTTVYGARPDNSAFLTESHPMNGRPRWGSVRDMVEIEAYCNGFRRQVPALAICVLRFPSIVGPTADTPLTRFLRNPWSPILLGFDPMMQVIHQDDVVGALVHAVSVDASHTYNVAAEGLLPLSQLTAQAGKLALPLFHPLAYWGTALLTGRKAPAANWAPIDLDYLRYPWVADLAKMRSELGYEPRYTASEALREFAGNQRLSQYRQPEGASLAYDEARFRDTIERRRREREREVKAVNTQEVGENA